MNPLTLARNLTPTSTAPLSVDAAVAGVADAFQIEQGQFGVAGGPIVTGMPVDAAPMLPLSSTARLVTVAEP